jgi:plastocyanin
LENGKLSRFGWLSTARGFARAAIGTSVVGLIGCPENKGDDKHGTADASAGSFAAASPTPVAAASAGDGTIRGTVTLTGKVPVMTEIIDRKGDPICAKTRMKSNDVVVDKKNDLQDVLVRIAPGGIKGKFPAPADALVEQKECMYLPKTFGIQSGGSIVVRNQDKTTHNVHTYVGGESQFNEAQPPGSPDIKLPEPGKTSDTGVITFKCDIHRWMRASAVVTDHPYFTVTGSDGTFELDKLPTGKFKLEAWHSTFGVKTLDVTVESGKPVAVNIAFNADTDGRVTP